MSNEMGDEGTRRTARRRFLRGALLGGLGAVVTRDIEAGPATEVASRTPLRGRNLNLQALEDLLVGCAYLGCGGGGSLAEGRAELAGAVQSGLRFSLLPVDALADDEWVASPYGIGSNAPPTEAEKRKYAALVRPETDPVEASFRLLSAHLHRSFVAAIPGELGPWSTAAALVTAARLGIPTLDADRVGRATPEATQDSVSTAGLSTVPLAAVTGFGDALILERVAAGSRVEDILRAISVTSLGELGVTDAALSGRDARRAGALVLGSLSLAERLGRANRMALAQGQDPIRAVIAAGEGFHLFEGVVIEFPWKDEAGFLNGEVLIEGRGRDRGSRYRIHYLNENLTAWRDSAVDVMPPDLISVVDSASGAAIANPDFTVGQRVTVIGFKAPTIWRTAAGLSVFGPGHFGLDTPYRPIEDRGRESAD